MSFSLAEGCLVARACPDTFTLARAKVVPYNTAAVRFVTTGKKIYSKAGKHIATIGYNDVAGRWEINALNEPVRVPVFH